MGLDTVPSMPRALRGRDATEECRWIMSLELDGGKHVRALPCLGGASTSFCLLAHAIMVDQQSG